MLPFDDKRWPAGILFSAIICQFHSYKFHIHIYFSKFLPQQLSILSFKCPNILLSLPVFSPTTSSLLPPNLMLPLLQPHLSIAICFDFPFLLQSISSFQSLTLQLPSVIPWIASWLSLPSQQIPTYKEMYIISVFMDVGYITQSDFSSSFNQPTNFTMSFLNN